MSRQPTELDPVLHGWVKHAGANNFTFLIGRINLLLFAVAVIVRVVVVVAVVE